MTTATAHLNEQLELADALRAGRMQMLEPQDLPGRYGRVVKALDRLLQTTKFQAVLAGGWAVWRHGYVAPVTQDVDIILAASDVDEFLRVASVAGFEILPTQPDRWPKLLHKETEIKVDIMPEGQRPGTPASPAPTKLPNPSQLGAVASTLRYVSLPALIALKLAAGRTQDENDVAQLIQANSTEIEAIRRYLATVHADYVAKFNQLVHRAEQQRDER